MAPGTWEVLELKAIQRLSLGRPEVQNSNEGKGAAATNEQFLAGEGVLCSRRRGVSVSGKKAVLKEEWGQTCLLCVLRKA